jgi:uncharacterized protein
LSKKIIISDSGPLIALALVDLIKSAPKIIGEIVVPETVYNECIYDLTKPGAKIIKKALADHQITLHHVPHSILLTELTSILDQGEAEAIMLYKEIGADLLLIDEVKGRKVAEKQNISITGTVAVLLKAKEKGIRPLVKPMIDKLLQHNYRLSKALITTILKRCDELPNQ